MRTPLATTIFFLAQVMLMLDDASPEVKNYLSMMLSQLTFVQSFVEDLLDMRQLKNGVFELSSERFSPMAVFELLLNIF